MGQLFYGTFQVKNLRTLSLIFKDKHFLDKNLFSGDFNIFGNLLGIKSEDIDLLSTIANDIFSRKYTKSIIANYFKKTNVDNFCYKRFLNYLDYKKINPTDSNSKKYYELVYGENWNYYFLSKKRKNVYDPIYISKRDNVSIEEAKIYIEKYKKSKATSKENFIKKHGIENGTSLFEKFQKTSKHTKEKMIEKYGEKNGLLLWERYLNKKRETSVFTVNYWISKGFSNEDAEIIRKNFYLENLSTSSIDYWMNRGLSKSDAIEKIRSICIKRNVAFNKASKQSLCYFQPLFDFFKSNNYDCYLGIKGSHEFTIFDEEYKKLKFFDFCIPQLKLIIEFNGDRWHPNPCKLSKKDWDNWRTFKINKNTKSITYIDADEAYANDEYKKQLAIKNGFDYIVIWSSDSEIDNWKKIKEALLKHGIKYFRRTSK